MSNGKGDTTRPPSVPRDTFAANWDRTFKTQERFSAYHRGEADAPEGYVDIRSPLPGSPDAPET